MIGRVSFHSYLFSQELKISDDAFVSLFDCPTRPKRFSRIAM